MVYLTILRKKFKIAFVLRRKTIDLPSWTRKGEVAAYGLAKENRNHTLKEKMLDTTKGNFLRKNWVHWEHDEELAIKERPSISNHF